MANKRELKKTINYMCSELFAECVAIMHYNQSNKQEDIDNVMTRILLMQDEFIRRTCHPEPGLTKKYYKRLMEDFKAQTNDIIDSINNLL